MALIDPQDIDNSWEDCARQLDQFASTANNFLVKGDDKYTIPVECIFFMNTNGRFPTTHEMTTDEYGLRSMYIDPVDLRMSSRQWELTVTSYYPRSVYDTCRILQILLHRILQWRIN